MKDLLSAYSFTSSTTTLDDLEISYIKEGSGEKTLLFVHGLSSNSDAWSKNIEILRKDYTCIALDLPGYGRSSKPDVDYTPSYFSEILHQFIEKLELKNIVLIGHSMGGQASIKFVSTFPNEIEKLILIAPAGLEQFSETNVVLMKSFFTSELVKNTSDEQIEKNYALNFHVQPFEVTKMIDDRKRIKVASDFDAHCYAIVSSVYGMLDDSVYDDLKAISQKTLVIFGGKDLLIPNRYFNPTITTKDVGNIAIEKINKVCLKFIEDAGHFVQFEKPNETNILIKQFVDDK
ncbi:alpha/beta fold hydrolase [Ulvibacter antarcticus]|nr:alpha/beta hydrolase [Ulvibacter antarcticus]